jgi:acyl-[acyl-carrier-protein]-phospholipid O-acyltransferase / long-chain-fatty-acid--[acyl-carrier-protein] ligase
MEYSIIQLNNITNIIYILIALGIIIAICTIKIRYFEVLQYIAKLIFKICYRVEITGLEHCINAGDKVIVIANHTSLIDAPILAACLPGKYMFAVNSEIAKQWWVKIPSILTKTYAIDPGNPVQTKSLIKAVKNGNKCIIFPEGRITTTGSLMKVYEGAAIIAEKSDAVILPIFIDGAQYSPFSYITDKVKVRWFPKIKLTISPHRKVTASPGLKGKAKREFLAHKVYDIMSNMVFEGTELHHNIFISLIKAYNFFGAKHIICEDITREKLNYSQLITKALAFSSAISRKITKTDSVGLMLPNTNANIIALFGLAKLGVTPALINYISGLPNIISCCKTCRITTIITSRKFIAAAKLEHIVKTLNNYSIKWIYLEDLAVPTTTKLKASLWSVIPRKIIYNNIPFSLNKAAVIVFTSGSDSVPKGVALSHKNIQTNASQLMASMDLNIQDILFNPLPSFHAFGLTIGTIMPIINGIKVFSYPSALHYKIIPEMIYDVEATLLISTNTFLSGYQKFAHPYDFSNLRYVFAGAEKLSLATKQTWYEQYGCRILEGYGASEASPVIAINTPMHHKIDTVGKILPGISHKLTKHEYDENSGKLWIKGNNVMLGYILASAPGVIEPLKDGWHDTGDIVTISATGFVTIIDRAKRFAKIAGEMISLSIVETMLNSVWKQHTSVAISMAHEKKGEQIICITTNKDATKKDLITYCNQHDIAAITIPNKIIIVTELPKLATGKINYPQIKKNISEL